MGVYGPGWRRRASNGCRCCLRVCRSASCWDAWRRSRESRTRREPAHTRPTPNAAGRRQSVDVPRGSINASQPVANAQRRADRPRPASSVFLQDQRALVQARAASPRRGAGNRGTASETRPLLDDLSAPPQYTCALDAPGAPPAYTPAPHPAGEGGARFCTRCGHGAPDPHAVFCGRCGAQLGA